MPFLLTEMLLEFGRMCGPVIFLHLLLFIAALILRRGHRLVLFLIWAIASRRNVAQGHLSPSWLLGASLQNCFAAIFGQRRKCLIRRPFAVVVGREAPRSTAWRWPFQSGPFEADYLERLDLDGLEFWGRKC